MAVKRQRFFAFDHECALISVARIEFDQRPTGHQSIDNDAIAGRQ